MTAEMERSGVESSVGQGVECKYLCLPEVAFLNRTDR